MMELNNITTHINCGNCACNKVCKYQKEMQDIWNAVESVRKSLEAKYGMEKDFLIIKPACRYHVRAWKTGMEDIREI